MHNSRRLDRDRLGGWRIVEMSINPLFSPVFFETALGRARPISFEMDLARARRILSSWTSFKRLSSDDAEIIARMIAQGIAEGRRYGLELAEAGCPTDGKNHLEALKDGLGAQS